MADRLDHYGTLGVARTANVREIRTAFRRLARLHHPDANGQDAGAARRFKRLVRAYEVLRDPSRRRSYDERLQMGRFGAPGTTGPMSFSVDPGPLYHSDLGHHSDFYGAGDPMTVAEAAALVERHPAWLRRAIREGRLAAERVGSGYLVRRRDVERLDRMAARRARKDRSPERRGQAAEEAAAQG